MLPPQRLPHAMWGGMRKRSLWISLKLPSQTVLLYLFVRPLSRTQTVPSLFLSIEQNFSQCSLLFNATLPSKVKTFASHVIRGWVKASMLLTHTLSLAYLPHLLSALFPFVNHKILAHTRSLLRDYFSFSNFDAHTHSLTHTHTHTIFNVFFLSTSL